jgi:dUTP pyrophosphatase
LIAAKKKRSILNYKDVLDAVFNIVSSSKDTMAPLLLKIQLLRHHIEPPKRMTAQSAGIDVSTPKRIFIRPLQRVRVPLGIAVEPPEGTYVRIAPRSGISLQGIDVGAGVVDADYRGELSAVLVNNSSKCVVIPKKTRIVQLICEKIEYPEVVIASSLKPTARNDKGFGSTD